MCILLSKRFSSLISGEMNHKKLALSLQLLTKNLKMLRIVFDKLVE